MQANQGDISLNLARHYSTCMFAIPPPPPTEVHPILCARTKECRVRGENLLSRKDNDVPSVRVHRLSPDQIVDANHHVMHSKHLKLRSEETVKLSWCGSGAAL